MSGFLRCLRFGAFVAFCVAATLAVAQRGLARWKVISKAGNSGKLALIVGNQPSGIVIDYDDAGRDIPTFKARKTNAGAILGSTLQQIDGAALWTEVEGFALYKGKISRFPDKELVGRAGEYGLFLPVIVGAMEPQMAGCGHATLYNLGSSVDIGWVRRAKLSSDGTVTGWYPVVDGKPYTGPLEGDTSPSETPNAVVRFTKRYFKYRNGRRFESDRPLH